MMQFRDIHAQYEAMETGIVAGIKPVIKSTGFILGKLGKELEDKLAAYLIRKQGE